MKSNVTRVPVVQLDAGEGVHCYSRTSTEIQSWSCASIEVVSCDLCSSFY